MVIRPFPVKTLKEILGTYNPAYSPDDLLCLYYLTGAIPRYVFLLMEQGAATKGRMLDATTQEDSPFLSDGRNDFILEIGKE